MSSETDTEGNERREHLEFCKKRALEYLDRGDEIGAFSSFVSDMNNEDSTRQHPALGIFQAQMISFIGNPERLRHEIEGFN